MPQVHHVRYAVYAWLKPDVHETLANCLFLNRFAVRDDFILNEIAKGGDPLGVAQFLGVGQKYGHFDRLHLGQDADKLWKVADQVIGQNANPEIIQHALKHAEVVVDGQERRD